MVRDERLAEPDAEAVARAASECCGRAVTEVTPISLGINAIYRVSFEDGEEVEDVDEVENSDAAVLKAATFNTTAELRPEPRLLKALARETTVPVPEVLAVVEDGGPLDVFHFVLDYCEGRQIRDLDRLSPGEQEQLVREIGRQLARLHEYRPTLGRRGRRIDACGPLRVTAPDDERATDSDRGFTIDSDHDSWSEMFASLAEHPIGLLEQVHCGEDPGRFADLVPDVVAAFEGVAESIAEPETPTLLHGDFRPDNLVLTPEDEGNLRIRSVFDFGDPYVGDYRFDLAFAEDATVRVALPTSDRADHLAELLRTTYARERGIDPDAIENGNYAYYLLLQRARWMAVAMDWESYDDPAAVERAYRSFVAEQLDVIA